MVSRAMAECKVCEGSGSFFQPKDKCKKCKGKQVTEERKLLEVYIPRGAKYVSDPALVFVPLKLMFPDPFADKVTRSYWRERETSCQTQSQEILYSI